MLTAADVCVCVCLFWGDFFRLTVDCRSAHAHGQLPGAEMLPAHRHAHEVVHDGGQC